MVKKNIKKKFEREAPNDEWLWKHRNEVKFLIPDIEIEEPKHLKKKENDEDEHL